MVIPNRFPALSAGRGPGRGVGRWQKQNHRHGVPRRWWRGFTGNYAVM